jgi:hypothetical protein
VKRLTRPANDLVRITSNRYSAAVRRVQSGQGWKLLACPCGVHSVEVTFIR